MADTLSIAADRTSRARRAADSELLAGLARGDAAAFTRIVRRHQQSVAGLARRLLGWRDDVEDVVQDVFLSVLNNVSSFRGEGRLATWIYRITVNQCRRHRHKRMLRLKLWHRPSAPGSNPTAPEKLAGGEDLATVRAAVRALPRRYREVVVLRYLEELPIADVCEILGLRRSAVETRLSRARQQLRGRLAGLLES